MSDIWRCQKGHSGTVDSAAGDGPVTLMTSCPICGDDAVSLHRQTAKNGDQTIAPDAVPMSGIIDGTIQLEAGSNGNDLLAKALKIKGNPLGNGDQTLPPDDSLSTPMKPDGTVQLDGTPSAATSMDRTLNLDGEEPAAATGDGTIMLADAPPSKVNKVPSTRDETVHLDPAVKSSASHDHTLDLDGDAPHKNASDGTLQLSNEASDSDRTGLHTWPPPSEEQSQVTIDVSIPGKQPGRQDDGDKTADGEPPADQTVDIGAGVVIRGLHIGRRGGRGQQSNEHTIDLGPTKAVESSSDTVPPEEGVESSPTVGPNIRRKAKEKDSSLPAIDGYDLLSELGRGGMGVVYKARQQGLNRLVALKMILAANRASAKDLARFSIEAEAIAQLVHANIVQVYEIGEREGCPFFSLEFVAGGTLSDRTESKAQPPKRAARIVQALALAMDFAHRRGIIHRDLKPANVLLALPENVPQPKDGEDFPIDLAIPKITDFGLAKRLEGDSGHTRDGAIMGTPNYMAPEQAKGKNKDIGPPADIYALGSMLYDLLTGTPPFKGSTIMETLQMVVNREPVPPRKVNALVPGDLSTICLKCLEKDPVKRYATAGHLAEDLRRYLEGEPIQARPVNWMERSVKWARRRPAAASLVGVCVLTVLGMSFGGVALAYHEKKNADAQELLKNQALVAKTEAQNAATAEAVARGRAEKERERAEENFLVACRAVDEMLARVGNQRLAHEPRMEQLRREVLQKAHQFYEKFLDQSSDDPNVQWRVARSSWQLGDIEKMQGDTKKAEVSYREAIKRFDPLVASNSKNAQYREDLANTHNSLGVLLNESQKLNEAETEFQAAHLMGKQLASEDVGNPHYQDLLSSSSLNLGKVQYRRGEFTQAKSTFTGALEEARTRSVAGDQKGRQIEQVLNSLGQTLQKMGSTAAAKTAFEQARDELQPLVDAGGRNASPELRQELALTYNNLGDLMRDRDPDAAEQAFRKALQLSTDLAADFPATPTYRQEMAGNTSNLALLLLAKGDGVTAEKLYLDAIAVKKKLADELPWAPDYRLDLVMAQNNRGVLLLASGRKSEADKLYEETVQTIRALVENYRNRPDYELELGKILVNQAVAKLVLNQADAAEILANEGLQTIKKLTERRQDSPKYRYELGRTQKSLGVVREQKNDHLRAEELYRAALETLTPLVEKNGEEPDYKVELAVTCKNLGDLLSRVRKSPDSFALWRKAIELLEPLTKQYRGVPEYRNTLAGFYNEYPRRLAIDGKLTQAETEWEVARKLQQELVAEFPLVLSYRLDLAKTWKNLAVVALRQNRNEVAAERYREALKALEEFKGATAETQFFLESLLENAMLLSDFLNASKVADTKDLLAVQKRVVDLCQKLAKKEGAPILDRARLAVAEKKYGAWMLEANLAGDARPVLEDAVANMQLVVKKLNNDAKQRAELLACYEVLFRTYEFLDAHAATAKACEGMLEANGKEALPHTFAAVRAAWCIAAVDRDQALVGLERFALKMVYADLAMRYLQEAVQLGFKDVNAIKNTPAFAPLQKRDDYKELLSKMEKGS